MSDLIKREDAINILDAIDVDIIPYADTREFVQSAIDYIRKELGDIPSARPNNRGVCGVCAGRKVCGENNRNLDMLECSIFELDEHYKISRPQGKWIEHEGKTIVMDNNFVDFFPTEYECSNCGLRQATYFINSPLPNYCPNCGSDNRERESE